MADFCKQCSLAHFGEDFGELDNLLSKEEAEQGLCVNALCEGCGATQVDIDGNCLEFDCLEAGHSEAHRAWITQQTGRTP